MDRGDRVLCVYDNTYRYSARVLAKYDNPHLARNVWGEGKDGKTWQYTYFLTEPKEIHRHVSELAGYLNASYFGFTKISDEKLEAIAAEYGSVEEFVDRAIEQTDRSNASALRAVLSWIRNLRTQASAVGRFYYKPLILLALLDLLDADSGHPNSFGYEEMWAAFEGLPTELGSSITEEQFSQPYVRIRNDVSPLQVWIPQVDGVAEIDDSKADRPAYVRTHAPSAQIDDSVWECFLSPDGRAAIRQEINSIWAQKGQDKQALWFEPLEHPPGLEAELQLILERSNRKDQDLLAAIFRRAILLNQQHKTEGFLGAQRKILQRFSITIGNVYACAVARNTRETLYLLVDNDTTLRQAYEVADARFSKSQLMWIHGGLDRDSLQSLLEDEAVWNAYERMLPKVTNFPLARSNHNNRGKLSVISGKRYEPESDLRPNYWWVNQGATYRQERDGGYLWAPKESKAPEY